MCRVTPGLTRTGTLFPYTTRVRSPGGRRDAEGLGRGRSQHQRRGPGHLAGIGRQPVALQRRRTAAEPTAGSAFFGLLAGQQFEHPRSEEHTSELQSLMLISYAVFCLKKKIFKQDNT